MKQQVLPFFLALFWVHSVFTQPIIKVAGVADAPAVEQQILQYLDYLDIWENVHLTICFTTSIADDKKGLTYTLNDLTPDSYQVIRVRIDARLNNIKRKQVLAHEMVHVKQFVKGELTTINDRQVLWKGNPYGYCGRGSSSKCWDPWEMEAHLICKLLVNLEKVPSHAPITKAGEKP